MEYKLEYIVPNISYMIDRYCSPSWHLANRRLSFYNLMIVVEGQCIFAWENNTAKLTAGYGTLVPPRMLHSAVTDPVHLMHCYAFNFEYYCVYPSDDGSKVCDYKTFPLPLDIVFKVSNLDKIVTLLREFNETWVRQRPGYRLKCNGLFNQILGELMTQQDLKGIDPMRVERIEKAVSFINEHYNISITLNDLARLTGLSPTYFEAEFKRIMGCTPIEYVNNVRINRSIEFVLKGNLSVTEIAEKVGFNDVFYFSKMFKRIVGISPKNYACSA